MEINKYIFPSIANLQNTPSDRQMYPPGYLYPRLGTLSIQQPWSTQLLSGTQGRNEVKWRPGHETSLVPPCLNMRSFGSIFKVLVTLLGFFGAPLVIGAMEIVPHLSPLVAPLLTYALTHNWLNPQVESNESSLHHVRNGFYLWNSEALHGSNAKFLNSQLKFQCLSTHTSATWSRETYLNHEYCS